jgi:hypothetical protein
MSFAIARDEDSPPLTLILKRANQMWNDGGKWPEIYLLIDQMFEELNIDKNLRPLYKRAVLANVRSKEERKRTHKRLMEQRPVGRFSTVADDRRDMLLAVASRPEGIGFPVGHRGFPPFSPNGVKLVEKGFVTAEAKSRGWGGNQRITYLYITEEGLKEVERIKKQQQKKAKNHG